MLVESAGYPGWGRGTTEKKILPNKRPEATTGK